MPEALLTGATIERAKAPMAAGSARFIWESVGGKQVLDCDALRLTAG
jgi:hypothetical protein